jgi:tetratricopeptide (TPR) repeat protein
MKVGWSSRSRIKASRRSDSAATLLLLVLAAFGTGCQGGLPQPSSQLYRDYVSAFYVGLAALQVGDDVRAEKELARSTALVSAEPAGWANWGILSLRQRDFDAASDKLERARKLAPRNGRIYFLLGLVETGKGHSAEAIADFHKSIDLDPKNLIATYQLAEEIERQGGTNSDAEFQQLMQRIVDAQPNNIAALLELGRSTAKRGDTATLRHVVESIKSESQSWPPEVQQQFEALQSAAFGPQPKTAALRTTYLRNVLMRLPSFRRDLAAIKPQPGDEAQPFILFLRMDTPKFTPAAADSGMHFDPQPLATTDKMRWTWIGAVSLGDAGMPTVIEANGGEVRLASGARFPFPGGLASDSPSPESIVPIDFNYDFKTDLVLAGAGGVRFYRQDAPSAFTDVTHLTRLPTAILNGNYTGGWAVDIEADGDLDLILGSRTGDPRVLRNDGDGTFTPIYPFRDISGIRGFVWADLNGDGNPDASLVDGAGRLRVFINQRLGSFKEVPLPRGIEQVKAIAAADASHRGILDLIAVLSDGNIVRLAQRLDTSGSELSTIAQVPNAAAFLAGEVRLHALDLDNNGAIDLLLGRVDKAHSQGVPGALLWLGDERGNFLPAMKLSAPSTVFDAAGISREGHLDLLGLGIDGQPIQGVNQGTRNYRWQIIRPRALAAKGDQRINSFGVGGEIEIRSGLLVQLQPIDGPQVHFGLGERDQTDVARVLWPNGTLRAEFALKADQQVVTEQRLKGSCPFLFAYNGSKIDFVKDAVPWGSAIGLRIDNQGTAHIAATEEWYKIPGSQLVPRDGYYDLRLTGELWETYYYDYLSLLVVDHPAGTEIFTDERFVVPAVKPRIIVTDEPHKIKQAVDDQGTDVTSILSDQDGRYLDTFGRGQYQGVTRQHYVDVDLGPNLPVNGPLYLIANGWLHPSDSSVNVAISQGRHEPEHALSLEVPNGRGGWVVALPNLGFPAGRNKTCVVDIANVFLPGAPHIVRLRTNLEVYWDSIQWAQGRPDISPQIIRLAPASADLHYRGYSTIHQANASSPELPDYNQLTGARQPWRDLEGYYTRYGDVRELLGGIDDRYVIMNAGDEMALRFDAQRPPQSGWRRDYVIAGDGWIKDGDYNSTYSKTVLPLPYHARTVYDTPPGRLEDEQAYRRHPGDWQTFHTRYVAPERFASMLRSGGTQ